MALNNILNEYFNNFLIGDTSIYKIYAIKFIISIASASICLLLFFCLVEFFVLFLNQYVLCYSFFFPFLIINVLHSPLVLMQVFFIYISIHMGVIYLKQ